MNNYLSMYLRFPNLISNRRKNDFSTLLVEVIYLGTLTHLLIANTRKVS